MRQLRQTAVCGGVELEVDGRCLVNFSSNDYLGLAGDMRLQQRAEDYARRYGSGATAARLICGNHPGFAAVEQKLARLKGEEAALVFNSGFQANVSLLPALADRRSLVLIDRLAHNSLYQGAVLSRARVQRYRHGDLGHLQQLLQQSAGQYGRTVMVTESVFSMDGDVSDVPALVALAQKYGALLLVDEAHATGVMGADGMGLAGGQGVDVVMGTFGKALGVFGAYIACSERLREYAINCCSGFVYSTGLPPGVLGAVEAALELVPGLGPRRQKVLEHAAFVRREATDLGYDTGASASQIVPLILGEESAVLALAAWLEECGALAVAIRPPTVEPGRARLRLALSAAHTDEQVEWLVGLLKEWRGRPA